jgi:hypothetical protein
MSTFIKGDANILYIHDDTIYRPVACLTSNSLASTLEVLETATKCDAGVTVKTAGVFAYSINADGLYIDTTSAGSEVTKASHDWLLAKQMAKATVTWKLDTGLADTGAYFGTALITNLNLDSPSNSENATFSATLDGSGAIVLVDPFAST